MLEIGKEVPKQGAIAKGKAFNELNNTLNVLRKFSFNQQQFSVSVTPAGWTVSLLPFEVGTTIKGNFSNSLKGNQVTIAAGNIVLHGIGTYRVEPDPSGSPLIAGRVTLTGSPDWTYVFCSKDGSSYGVDHMATFPTTDTNMYRWALCKFEIDPSGAYYLVETCHLFDVGGLNPIR